jgi:hypothetical protein
LREREGALRLTAFDFDIVELKIAARLWKKRRPRRSWRQGNSGQRQSSPHQARNDGNHDDEQGLVYHRIVKGLWPCLG